MEQYQDRKSLFITYLLQVEGREEMMRLEKIGYKTKEAISIWADSPVHQLSRFVHVQSQSHVRTVRNGFLLE